MGFVLSSAAKDLRRRLRDPLALVLWAGIPLVVGLLLQLAFGGEDATPQAHLLVADQDDSFLSRALVSAFGQGRLGEIVETEPVDAQAGRERLDAGDASALLVIPAGFGDALLRERPTRLQLVTNPAQTVLPAIVEESLSLLVDGIFYLQRLLAEPLRAVIGGPPASAPAYPDSTVASVSVAINRVVERVQPYLFPPAIQLETKTIGQAAADSPGFATLFFPGTVFMALLFLSQGFSEDVWKERRLGTLRRAVTAPRPVAAFLAGKLLAGGAIIAAVVLLGLIAGRWAFGIPLVNLPLALVWATFAGAVLLALMVLIQLHASSERAGNLLTGAILFPLAMLGGSFFPFEVMPEWLAAIGRRTPNGWALTQFASILRDRMEAAELAAAFVAMLLVGALAFALSAMRLGRFARG